MFFPNFGYMFIQKLHINHKKCQLGRHSALGRRCYAKLLKFHYSLQVNHECCQPVYNVNHFYWKRTTMEVHSCNLFECPQVDIDS